MAILSLPNPAKTIVSGKTKETSESQKKRKYPGGGYAGAEWPRHFLLNDQLLSV